MDFGAALTAFALLFVAEMGDKTQLMAMTLAHRYPAKPVLAGAFLAFLVLNLLAVLLGAALYAVIPTNLLLFVAGALFLVFAWRSWNTDDDAEDDLKEKSRGAFLTSFTLIFVAELGDKTQIAMIALAASSGAVWSVFIGGTLALWVVCAIGVAVGSTLLRRLPKKTIHRAAGILFGVFGVVALVKAVMITGN